MGNIQMQRKEYKLMERYMACDTLMRCYTWSLTCLQTKLQLQCRTVIHQQ